jgi:hypothetical protein
VFETAPPLTLMMSGPMGKEEVDNDRLNQIKTKAKTEPKDANDLFHGLIDEISSSDMPEGEKFWIFQDITETLINMK